VLRSTADTIAARQRSSGAIWNTRPRKTAAASIARPIFTLRRINIMITAKTSISLINSDKSASYYLSYA